MVLSPLMAAGFLAAASLASPAGMPQAPPSALTNAVAVTLHSRAGNAATPMLERGQEAPDFVYQSHDHLWQNLHNMLEESHILLVFGASQTDLAQIERERESLRKLGISPVAVVNERDGDARKTLRQLNLGFSLLADPRGAIGEQYGVRDASVAHDRAMWFVIDQDGEIRDRGEGLHPKSGWPTLAMHALDLPPAEITATD